LFQVFVDTLYKGENKDDAAADDDDNDNDDDDNDNNNNNNNNIQHVGNITRNFTLVSRIFHKAHKL